MGLATAFIRFLFLGFALLPSSRGGQRTEVSLQALSARYDPANARIILTCQLTNGDSAQRFYRPQPQDYCLRFSYLEANDATSGKQVVVSPVNGLPTPPR
jgi:hypothetical protein